jgi:TonB family protein
MDGVHRVRWTIWLKPRKRGVVMGPRRAIFPIAVACSLGLHLIATTLWFKYGSYLLSPRWKSAHNPELVIKVDPELMDFGEATGRGIGLNSSPGDHPMDARDADENQALLSREPTGFGNRLQTPSDLQGPNGGGPSGAAAMAPSPPTPPRKIQEQVAAALPAPPSIVPEVSETMPKPQIQINPLSAPIQPQVVQQPKPPVQVAAASGNQNAPGVPTSAGKPLPQSESDSDPFARISGTVIYHNGRLEVQMGRKVNTVRPQLGIAGEMDAYSLTNPTVIVEVHIDPTGKVSNVELVRKSGSVAIDEPTRNAVYQWWFEPAHDKAGHPIRDVVCFAIEYR